MNPKRIIWLPIDHLNLSSCTLNGHSGEKLRESINTNGIKMPLLIDKDGLIIGGVKRFNAAKQLGHKFVPVVIEEGIVDLVIRFAGFIKTGNCVSYGHYSSFLIATKEIKGNKRLFISLNGLSEWIYKRNEVLVYQTQIKPACLGVIPLLKNSGSCNVIIHPRRS